MVRSIGLIRRILGFTLVSDISNISRVGIPNIVGDNLGTAIGKSYTVFARGSNTITVLTLSKVVTRVVISDSITVLVESWAFISGLMVSRLRVSGLVGGSLVNNGSRVVDRSGFVDNWGRVVDRSGFVDNRGRVVHRSRIVDRGRIVDGSLVVDGRVGVDVGVGLSMSMVNGVTVDVVGKSMVTMNVGMVTMDVGMVTMDVGMVTMNVGMVSMKVGMVTMKVGMVTMNVGMVTMKVGMVTMNIGMVTMEIGMVTMNVGMVTMNGSMVSMVEVKSSVVARGVDTSNKFLLIVVLVNLIGSGSGLGVHSGVIFTMGSIDGGRDRRGVAMLDALVAVLVGGSQGQEGRENDKSLHVLMMVIDRTKFQ